MIQHRQCPGVCRASGAGGGYPRSEPCCWQGNTPLHTEAAAFPKVWSSCDAWARPTSEPQGHANLLEPQAPQRPAPAAQLQVKPKNGHTSNFNPVIMGDGNHHQGHRVHAGDGSPRRRDLCAPLSAIRTLSSETVLPMACPQERKDVRKPEEERGDITKPPQKSPPPFLWCKHMTSINQAGLSKTHGGSASLKIKTGSHSE